MNHWGTSWASHWGASWGAAAVQPAASAVEGPNVYQMGGYPPPRKKPMEIVVPPELAALLKKSDAQIQYEKRLKRLALAELL